MTASPSLGMDSDAATSPPPASPRPPSIWKRELTGYLVLLVLCTLFLVHTLRLDRADLSVPMSPGDGMYHQMQIQAILESGWYQRIPRLGQPGESDLREHPASDGWTHMLLIKLLGVAVRDSGLLLNLFFLLTFPLVALTTHWMLRRLEVPLGVSLGVSLLYTFLPYHFFRGAAHLCLSAYYVLPLALLVILRICQGRLPFVCETPGTNTRAMQRRRTLGAVVIGVVVGMGGAYYALFSCVFALLAGGVRAVQVRRLAPLTAGTLFAGVIFTALLVTLAPSLLYRFSAPFNPDHSQRFALETEPLGLRLTQLLLPRTGHRLAALRDFKDNYRLTTIPTVAPNEADFATLGFIGSAGFLVLIGRMFFRRQTGSSNLLDGLAALNLGAVLLATAGGFGVIFAFLGFPWIRAYNRISVYIALFALTAVALLLTRVQRRWVSSPRRQLAFGGLLALLIFAGLRDQTIRMEPAVYSANAREYYSDRAFVRAMEAQTGPEQTIFQLPYIEFPEGINQAKLGSSDPLKPYLHSRTLKFSFGSLRGHWGDLWCREVSRLPAGQMARILAAAGFAGICIDRDGYEDHACALEKEFKAASGIRPLDGSEGHLLFFDLKEFTRSYRSQFSSSGWEAVCAQARWPILPQYRKGFYLREHVPELGDFRWCDGQGELYLENRQDHSRHVCLQGAVQRAGEVPARLRIEAGEASTEVDMSAAGQKFVLRLTVPPGATVVRFLCDAPPLHCPQDTLKRRLVFEVIGLECKEMDGLNPDPQSGG